MKVWVVTASWCDARKVDKVFAAKEDADNYIEKNNNDRNWSFVSNEMDVEPPSDKEMIGEEKMNIEYTTTKAEFVRNNFIMVWQAGGGWQGADGHKAALRRIEEIYDVLVETGYIKPLEGGPYSD